ncbi:ribonuclease P protein component [Porphyromonadaceae bacterium OttesenSCG-928-L07]|nr:ribonuclease P protein component [Porphyromonadaceae bacterium OttesenSCG-928-L07]MDL2252330.1 ribonuclease P protein component [Odoribacter sp. OttesenSCG-928-J03]
MNSFCKSERLTHKSLFEELFLSGFSFIKYPFRVVVKESSVPGEYPARIAISVSKKKFKAAVKRNRVKRLVREAFRLNKHSFYECAGGQNKTYDIIFIYLDYQLPSSHLKIEKAMKNSLSHIIKHFHISEDAD